MTATDAAVAAGLVEIGDPKAAAALPRDLARAVLDEARRKIEDAVDRMKTEAGDVPLIAVGGAAFLVPDRVAGISQVIRVPHGDCANAVGAAIAQISGETDQVYRDLDRAEAIAVGQSAGPGARGRRRRRPRRAFRPLMSRTCRSPICQATLCASACGSQERWLPPAAA